MHPKYKEFFKRFFALSAENTQKNNRLWLERLPPPDDLDIDYVLDFLADKSKTTKYRYLSMFKRLFKYLEREDELKGVKVAFELTTVKPDHLYTHEEIKSILMACSNTQDRALIETLYETAARSSELLSMDINSIVFADEGVVAIIKKSKTQERALPIQECVPSLRQWLNVHPLNEDKRSALWISHLKPFARLGVAGLLNRVKTLLDRSGVSPRDNPTKRGIVKLFRHTRLTELSRRGISEPTLRAYAGWTDGSLMSKVYVHLSGKDMSDEILTKIHGIPISKVKLPEQLLKSRECKRCHNMNSSTAVRCSECDMLLVQDEIETLVDEKIKDLLDRYGSVSEIRTWTKKNKK